MCCFLGRDQIIGSNSDEQQKSFGRHFEMEDELVSHITRRSIDLLKENYRASRAFLSMCIGSPCLSAHILSWFFQASTTS